MKIVEAAAFAVALASGTALAQQAVLYDGGDGATCDYFNYGARIAWQHRQADWMDATGAAQGEQPFARVSVRAADGDVRLRWDVTKLVRDWLSGRNRNDGIVVTGLRGHGTGTAVLHSREAVDPRQRPRLVVTLAGGKTVELEPHADTTLDCTTFTSLGLQPELRADVDRRIVMQFDLGVLKGAHVADAAFEATLAKGYGEATLGVFRLAAPVVDSDRAAKPRSGLAARYRNDRGIASDAAVLMASGFDNALWRQQWSYVSPRSEIERVDHAPSLGFQPLDGAALQVAIPAGQNLGLDMGYRFADKLGHEPDEIYFRYYLRLASDWLPVRDGGKLPGLSATYSHAGWGGRKADGRTGWSMRGNFYPVPEVGNPAHDRTPIGTYGYHADMQDSYGDAWPWSGGGHALLERNRWYCIEQYVKLNRLGRKDGILRAWVDGWPVFEKTDLHLRDVDSIRIEQVWMNVYFGGIDPTPRELHLFIDNVVIARQYIGPMAR